MLEIILLNTVFIVLLSSYNFINRINNGYRFISSYAYALHTIGMGESAENILNSDLNLKFTQNKDYYEKNRS